MTGMGNIMNEDKLYELLTKVHERLQAPGEMDSATQEMLEKVLKDADEVLNREVSDPQGDLADRIEQQALQFEEEFPTLSGVMRQIIDTLGRIGI